MPHRTVVGILAVAAMVGAGAPVAHATELPAPIVYVTNTANFGGSSGNIARFTIDGSGDLTPVDIVKVGEQSGARSMVFTPDGRFAYLANTGLDEILIFAVGLDGALHEAGSVDTPGPFAMAIAPDGGTIYASNLGTPLVSPFAVDAFGGLTPLAPVNTGVANSKGVAVTPDGRYLYVSHGDPSDNERSVLTGFALQPDGEVGSQVAKEQIGISGAETVITPDGRFIYVVHQTSNDVHGFRISADGSLTPVPGSPVPAGDFVEGAAISPDGNRLYVAAVGIENGDHTFPGQVVGFTIGLDGQLIESVPRVNMTSPIGIGFTGDGRFMYVSDFTDSKVNAFAVDAGGQLILSRAWTLRDPSRASTR